MTINREDYITKRSSDKSPPTRKQKTHRSNGQGIIRFRKDRKNPYMALVCTGTYFDANGKEQCRYKSIGSFPTRFDAEKALAEYITNPYELSSRIKTFSDLYNAWYSDYKTHGYSDGYLRSVRSAYSYCNALYDKPIAKIGPGHIKDIMFHGFILDKEEW